MSPTQSEMYALRRVRSDQQLQILLLVQLYRSKELLKILIGSARAFEYLHGLEPAPVLHRDIKSENILLTEDLDPVSPGAQKKKRAKTKPDPQNQKRPYSHCRRHRRRPSASLISERHACLQTRR